MKANKRIRDLNRRRRRAFRVRMNSREFVGFVTTHPFRTVDGQRDRIPGMMPVKIKGFEG